MAMEQSEIKYFDAKFDALSEKIDGIANRTEKDIERHRTDLDNLFNKNLKTEGRLEKLEAFRENHEKTHEEKSGSAKFRWEIVVAMVSVLIALAALFLRG